jgi:hypothetical protein
MNGSQIQAALAYTLTTGNVSVKTLRVDNMDKGSGGGTFDWLMGIFASGALSSDSRVNILAANFGHAVDPDRNSIALSFGRIQGTSNANDPRAFSLGNDFKTDIGGRADANTDSHELSPVGPNEETNVINIIGAMSKGMSSGGTDESFLMLASGWTVNTFGPVEDLKNITVRGESALNLSDATSNIRTIEIERPRLHI